MTPLKVVAFDVFGTVAKMDEISRDEIKTYVAHVRKNDFSPFTFPQSWWDLKLHPDAAQGIKMLQDAGYMCVTLSNGSADLLEKVSTNGGVSWDQVIDLVLHRVYKPHEGAYRTVQAETGYRPEQSLMVTANPTFGDIEGSAAIGMRSQVIRHGYPNTIIELAEMLAEGKLPE